MAEENERITSELFSDKDHESETELEDAVGLEDTTHKIGDTEARCSSKSSMNSFSTPVIITKNPAYRLKRGPSESSIYNISQGVSELMDGRGCAILALELVPKNLIFT